VDRTELDDDEIRLTVPARPEFARVARVASGGLAARLGFGYEEIEEIRLALGEAWAVLLGSDPADGSVELRFRVLPKALSVELTASVTGQPAPPTVPPATEPVEVLRCVTDELDVDLDRRWLRMEKHQRR
jgi:anti-sigma regulatory factor (Ser/Thr protein kinase)